MPPWYGERMLALGEQRAARDRALRARSRPGLLDDLDPVRAGRDRLPAIKEAGKVVNERTTNWTIVPGTDRRRGPTLVHPDLAGRGGAGAARRADRSTCCGSTRTTRSRPGARAPTRCVGGRRAADRARLRRAALRGRRAPTSRSACCRRRAWQAARFETVDGIEHMPNLPTEEVFTSPDPRARGRARDLHQAARAGRRHRRARPARALRGRPRRAGRRRHGAGHDAHDRSAATRAPPGSARSRWSTARAASARSTRSSTTRCSTRTPPATSRSARASRSWSATSDARARQRERDPHRLHDRLAGADGHRHHRATASASRCSSRARWQI